MLQSGTPPHSDSLADQSKFSLDKIKKIFETLLKKQAFNNINTLSISFYKRKLLFTVHNDFFFSQGTHFSCKLTGI